MDDDQYGMGSILKPANPKYMQEAFVWYAMHIIMDQGIGPHAALGWVAKDYPDYAEMLTSTAKHMEEGADNFFSSMAQKIKFAVSEKCYLRVRSGGRPLESNSVIERRALISSLKDRRMCLGLVPYAEILYTGTIVEVATGESKGDLTQRLKNHAESICCNVRDNWQRPLLGERFDPFEVPRYDEGVKESLLVHVPGFLESLGIELPDEIEGKEEKIASVAEALARQKYRTTTYHDNAAALKNSVLDIAGTVAVTYKRLPFKFMHNYDTGDWKEGIPFQIFRMSNYDGISDMLTHNFNLTAVESAVLGLAERAKKLDEGLVRLVIYNDQKNALLNM